MPLKPALIDDLVGKVRRHCERLNELAIEVQRRGTRRRHARELKQLESEAGLPAQARSVLLLEQIERERSHGAPGQA